MTNDAIIVTTETEEARRQRRLGKAVVLLAGLFLIGIAVLYTPDGGRCIAARIAFAGFFGALTVAGFILPFLHKWRGTWRLDDNGILFTPLRGKPRSMAWPDVEAIHAHTSRIGIVFCAGSNELPLVFQWESRMRKREMIDVLRKKLGGSFDFFDRQPEKTSIRRLAWISLVAAAVALVCCGAIVLPCRWMKYEHYQLWAAAWLSATFALLCCGIILFVWRHRRDGWSWRKPQ